MFPISLKSMNDQQRHNYVLETYVLNQSASIESRRYKRDIDVIKEHHRFLWTEEDDETADEHSWETRLARRYYEKLFKEYCIADLCRYKENKLALRWRTEAEVVAGKGQFRCGCVKCEQRDLLRSWEVNFVYREHGERKNALVKLRLCPDHSAQLNYNSRKREIKRSKHAERQKSKDAKRRTKHTTAKTSKRTASEAPTRIAAAESASDNEMPEEDDVQSAQLATAAGSSKEQEATHATAVEPEASGDIWGKKLDVVETSSRETDFQRYLEDLLL